PERTTNASARESRDDICGKDGVVHREHRPALAKCPASRRKPTQDERDQRADQHEQDDADEKQPHRRDSLRPAEERVEGYFAAHAITTRRRRTHRLRWRPA